MSVLKIDTFFVLKRSLVEVYQLQSCNCKSPTCVKSRRPYYIHFRRESREERTETEFETYNLLITRSMPREVVFNDENHTTIHFRKESREQNFKIVKH